MPLFVNTPCNNKINNFKSLKFNFMSVPSFLLLALRTKRRALPCGLKTTIIGASELCSI